MQSRKGDVTEISSSIREGKWNRFEKIADAAADATSKQALFEQTCKLIDNVHESASTAGVLYHTCGVIQRFTGTLAEEIQMHASILVTPDGLDRMRTQDSMMTLSPGAQVPMSAEEKVRLMMDHGRVHRSSSASSNSLAVGEDVILKVLPRIQSSLLKLVHRLNMLQLDVKTPYAEGGRERKVMLLITAVTLVTNLRKRLVTMTSDLRQIDLERSPNLAKVPESITKKDQVELLENLLKALQSLFSVDGLTRAEIGWEAEGEDEDEAIDLPASPLMGNENLVRDVETIIDTIQTAIDLGTLRLNPGQVLGEVNHVVESIYTEIASFCDQKITDIEDESVEVGETLSRSDFGDAYKGTFNGMINVMMKSVKFRKRLNILSRRELQIEMKGAKKIEHEKLVTFYGSCILNDTLHLIWEFYDTPLSDMMFPDGFQEPAARIEPETVLKFAMDICSGLEYLHSIGVVHQFLTPKSIFLKGPDGADGLVIGDYSFVGGRKELADKLANARLETPSRWFDLTYSAPEVFNIHDASQITFSCFARDIYAFGVMLFEMLDGRKVFHGMKAKEISKRLLASVPRRPAFSDEANEVVPNTMKSLVHRCWQQAPAHRPSASSILEELGAMLSPEEEVEEAPPVIEEPVPRQKTFERNTSMKRWKSGEGGFSRWGG